MQCKQCNERPEQSNGICDICATFADVSYDRNYALSVQHSRATTWDDLDAEVKFKWQQAARESRERIAAKYPSKLLTKRGEYANI